MTTQTIVLIYIAISLVTTGLGYLWGYLHAAKRWEPLAKNAITEATKAQQLLDILSKHRNMLLKQRDEWVEKYETSQETLKYMKKQRDMLDTGYEELKQKYKALQKEIECSVHETHEETERPHVDLIQLEKDIDKLLSETTDEELVNWLKGKQETDARWLSGEPVPSEDLPLYNHTTGLKKGSYEEFETMLKENEFLDSVYGKVPDRREPGEGC